MSKKRLVGLGLLGMMLVGWTVCAWAEGTDKVTAQIYGYLKMDAAYDTGQAVTGNYMAYVKSDSSAFPKDNQFNLTANQSRFGVKLDGPDFAGGKTNGKLELDFYSGLGTENKAAPMMRHAYLELAWPDSGLSVLAGQTWDLILPIFPDTVNYGANLYAGVIGYRRPQLRLSKTFNLDATSKLIIKAAAVRTIGHAASVGTAPLEDSGSDSGVPTVQGSVTYSVPLLAKAPVQVVVSGMKGREELERNITGAHTIISSYALVANLLFPLTDALTLKGAFWKGSALDLYYGGIGQGYNATTYEAINAQGGWAELGMAAGGGLQLNLGGGTDVPQSSQLASGARIQNSSVFANAIYNVNSAVQVGLEVSGWRTLYKNLLQGENLRTQLALTYNF